MTKSDFWGMSSDGSNGMLPRIEFLEESPLVVSTLTILDENCFMVCERNVTCWDDQGYSQEAPLHLQELA